MSIELPAGARDWQQRVRAFVDTELIPWEVHAELHEGELPEDVASRHRRLARELHLHAIDTPLEHGGLQLPTLTQVVIWEQLGRVTNALSWCFTQPLRWMWQACDAFQREHWIEPLLRGERHECYAITEAGPGSDLAGIQATARREGNHYRLDAEKWYVTSANHADFFLLQARLTEGAHAGQHALFLVDADTPGITMVRSPAFCHTFAAHHPVYRFESVQVPGSHRIGAEGDGMRYTHGWFRHERLMIAARCCGAAQRLIEEASLFAEERLVDGQPLARQQAIAFMLADSATELWAARLMTYETAAAHDRGEDIKLLHARCSMAKLYASEMANRVADRAVQIFGGRGYMRENVAERFFRELRVERIWEGTSEVQRLIVARALSRRGAAALLG